VSLYIQRDIVSGIGKTHILTEIGLWEQVECDGVQVCINILKDRVWPGRIVKDSKWAIDFKVNGHQI
jgi:hypothetical protein